MSVLCLSVPLLMLYPAGEPTPIAGVFRTVSYIFL
jgi:hypothetical protein